MRGAIPPGATLGIEAPSGPDLPTKVLLVGPAELEGEAVADTRVNKGGPESRPYVSVSLQPQAAKTFEALTGRLTGRRLAVILDGRVLMAPVVQQAISGGNLQITPGHAASAH